MNGKLSTLPLALLAAAVVAATAGAAGSRAYADPAGDSGAAPDVVGATVSNDDAGLLQFALSIGNRAELQAGDVVTIAIDTDRNRVTGGVAGADYLIMANAESYGLAGWNGSSYDWNVPRRSLSTRDGKTFQIHRSELGNPAAFDFFVLSFLADPESVDDDLAPDGDAVWTYELELKPELRSFTATFAPAAPKAGARFVLRGVRITLGGTGRVVSAEGMRCTARLAGRPLPAVGRCAWRLPASAKGKRLVVSTVVSYGGANAPAGPFVFRVR